MRRGDMQGVILPRRISRLPANTIVTQLQTSGLTSELVTQIAGAAPEETASAIANFGQYPVAEGSLYLAETSRGSQMQWRTGAYTNSWGDSCDGSYVRATFIELPTGCFQLTEYELDETCASAQGIGVNTFKDGSIRPWGAIVGAAPEPNVSMAGC